MITPVLASDSYYCFAETFFFFWSATSEIVAFKKELANSSGQLHFQMAFFNR